MTRRRKPKSPPSATTAAALDAGDDQVERAMGRMFALGLPVASLAGALIAGFVVSVGSALLVLAGGALLGAIALFWASVRTLSDDSPLSHDFATLGATYGKGALLEEKRRVLRALKDLENEHDLGKIDDADYRSLTVTYRDQAKELMRQMDGAVAPFREEAERLAAEHVKKHGAQSSAETSVEASEASATDRTSCLACRASNEADAAFCKQCGSPMSTGTSSAPS
jgi:hypothetical protein